MNNVQGVATLCHMDGRLRHEDMKKKRKGAEIFSFFTVFFLEKAETLRYFVEERTSMYMPKRRGTAF